eukprot:321432-Rhodomonas_salina.2
MQTEKQDPPPAQPRSKPIKPDGNCPQWSEKLRSYFDTVSSGKGQSGEKYGLRYIGNRQHQKRPRTGVLSSWGEGGREGRRARRARRGQQRVVG